MSAKEGGAGKATIGEGPQNIGGGRENLGQKLSKKCNFFVVRAATSSRR